MLQALWYYRVATEVLQGFYIGVQWVSNGGVTGMLQICCGRGTWAIQLCKRDVQGGLTNATKVL